jgi:hypothetical protein
MIFILETIEGISITIAIGKKSLNDFYYTRVPGFSGIGRTREGMRLQDHICALC